MPRHRTPPTLTEAIYRRDGARVDQFLAEGADPNQPHPRHRADRGVRTLPLTLAVEQNDADLVRKLIAAGADPNGVAGHYSPAAKAIAQKSVAMLELLHGAGANLNNYRAFGGLYASYLEEACAVGSADVVDWLIAQGADPRQLRDTRFSAVHTTLINGLSPERKKILRVLRDRGADLLAAGGEGEERYHPVSYVAAFGDGEVMDWFLDAGADPNLVRTHSINGGGGAEGEGLPLLGAALIGKSPDKAGLVKSLLAHGARLDVSIDFNLHTIGPCTTLAQPYFDQSPAVARLMGGDYLMLACAWGEAPCVQLLIERGMDPNATSSNGQTPLLALSRRTGRGRNPDDTDKLRVLLEAGANPNIPDEEGYTTVHHFGAFGNMLAHASEKDREWVLAAVDLLLAHGADLTVRNMRGETPVDVSHGDGTNPVHARLVAAVEHEALHAQTKGAPSRRARVRF